MKAFTTLLATALLVACVSVVRAEPVDPLASWKSGVKISPATDGQHHSIHAYFNTTPESPDGRWLLYYVSTSETGHDGDIRIRERATGKETVLARGVSTEDAHRAACQQWVCNGKRVVFHNVLPSGEWVVIAIDVETGKDRLLARGRQLGFGQPAHDLVPLYGPHWNPGDYRDLELLNVATGDIRKTGLTADALKKAYPDWIAKQYGDKPLSIFFPLLSPDLSRVMCKAASPAGGDFRSRNASFRYGLICYDLEKSKFLSLTEQWGHPAWRFDSREIINMGKLIDPDTGKFRDIPDYPKYRGDHPSYSPDGKLFATDTVAETFGGPKGFWDVVVGDVATGKVTTVHRFDNSQGARSWRVSHPHPVFSPDGKRLYFNVSNGPWTRLHVAEIAGK